MPSGSKEASTERGAVHRQRRRRDGSSGAHAGGPGGHPSPITLRAARVGDVTAVMAVLRERQCTADRYASLLW